MNIVVYTALIGDIDKLWSICPTTSEARFVAFVDSIKSEVGTWGGTPAEIKTLTGKPNGPSWEQVLVDKGGDPRRSARYYKTMPHLFFSGADVSIWIDANVRLRTTPEAIVEKYLKNDLATFNHPERSNVYSEAKICERLGKDKGSVLRSQVEGYRRRGFDEKTGLAETRVVVRRLTPKMTEFNERWWLEIKLKSVRDQISFSYICWLHKLKWDVIPGRCLGTSHPHFLYIPHRVSRK